MGWSCVVEAIVFSLLTSSPGCNKVYYPLKEYDIVKNTSVALFDLLDI
jgi:AAA15 family ATPase/GTPase